MLPFNNMNILRMNLDYIKSKLHYWEIIWVILLWTPSFALIKVALETGTGIQVHAYTTIMAAFILVFLNGVSKLKPYLTWEFIKKTLILSLLCSLAPRLLLIYAAQLISTIWLAFFGSLIPLITLVLSAIFDKEYISLRKVVGCFISLFGVLILLKEQFVGLEAGTDYLMGVVLAFLACFLNAVTLIFARRNFKDVHPEIPLTYNLVIGSIICIPLLLLSPEPLALPDFTSFPLLIIIAVVNIVLGYKAYYHAVQVHGAVNTSIINYALPITRVIVGFVFLNELIDMNFLLAFVFVCSGLFIMSQQKKTNKALLANCVVKHRH